MSSRAALIALIALIAGNTIVLLGQVWPEGAPAFAREVSIAVLVANLLAFGLQLGKRAQQA